MKSKTNTKPLPTNTFTIDGNHIEEVYANKGPKQKRKIAVPWVDKYRPVKLDDIVHQDDTINILKTIVKTGNMPHLLFHGPAGVGKCLAPNTNVLMFNGNLRMAKDVIVGDELMGDDGTVRYVTNINNGRDIMYNVKQQYGDDYIVNSEHIISLKLVLPYIITTYQDRGGWEIMYFENFQMRVVFVTDINNFKFDNSNGKNVKGDICNIPIKNYVGKSILWKKCFKGYKCGELNPIGWNAHYDNAYLDGSYFDFNGSDGITEKYKVASLESRKKFIQGLMKRIDGGDVNYSNKCVFDNVMFIFRSLGYLVDNVGRIVNSDDNTCGIEIEKLDNGEYYGFEITGNRLFLLGDFTVTHNTSSILSIANELFGANKVEERVIELNASDERGINIVRQKIVTLAKTSVSEKDENYTCPPYKIIILDEADAMTVDAQSALRKIMEDNSSITRFCFVCNFINQIIDPIISRCSKFRFKSIGATQMNTKLMHISKCEKMIINEDAINVINYASNGDMRKAITLLQNLNYLGRAIDANDVYKMACIIPKENINNALNVSMSVGDGAYKIGNLVNNIIMDGYPLSNVLTELVMAISNSDKLTDYMKSAICVHICYTELRLNQGADEYMQLLSVFMCIKNISNNLISGYDMI